MSASVDVVVQCSELFVLNLEEITCCECLRMAIESLSGFEAMSFLPHVIVYAVYVAMKYSLLLTELVLHLLSRCHHSVGKVVNSDIVHILFFLLSLLGSCFCCCCCCGQKRGAISYLFNKAHILSAKVMHFVVSTLFGSGESIVKRYLKHGKAKKPKSSTTIPKLYIRNMELGPYEISHLTLLVFTFLLLASITCWDVYFLAETNVCSENADISCFPLLKDSSTNEIELAIDFSKIHEQQIANCSFWNSENISSQVTFICFQWVFNSGATISAFGGLLTVFSLTVRIVTAALIALTEVMVEKVTQRNGEWINVCSSFRFRIGDGLKAVRLTVLVLVACFELTLGLLLSIGYARVKRKHMNELFMFYRKLGNQVLMSIGILSIILLLPFEKYATNESSHTEVPDDESESEEGEEVHGHQIPTEDV